MGKFVCKKSPKKSWKIWNIPVQPQFDRLGNSTESPIKVLLPISVTFFLFFKILGSHVSLTFKAMVDPLLACFSLLSAKFLFPCIFTIPLSWQFVISSIFSVASSSEADDNNMREARRYSRCSMWFSVTGMVIGIVAFIAIVIHYTKHHEYYDDHAQGLGMNHWRSNACKLLHLSFFWKATIFFTLIA